MSEYVRTIEEVINKGEKVPIGKSHNRKRKKMTKTSNIYINLEDFQKFILNYVQSDEINKAFESTIFFNDPAKSELCFQAMLHGLIWGSLLANQLPKFYVEEEKK